MSRKHTLEQRVRVLEDLLGMFAMRMEMLASGLHEGVERKIRGVHVIRGNNGVKLAAIQDSPEKSAGETKRTRRKTA